MVTSRPQTAILGPNETCLSAASHLTTAAAVPTFRLWRDVAREGETGTQVRARGKPASQPPARLCTSARSWEPPSYQGQKCLQRPGLGGRGGTCGTPCSLPWCQGPRLVPPGQARPHLPREGQQSVQSLLVEDSPTLPSSSWAQGLQGQVPRCGVTGQFQAVQRRGRCGSGSSGTRSEIFHGNQTGKQNLSLNNLGKWVKHRPTILLLQEHSEPSLHDKALGSVRKGRGVSYLPKLVLTCSLLAQLFSGLVDTNTCCAARSQGADAQMPVAAGPLGGAAARHSCARSCSGPTARHHLRQICRPLAHSFRQDREEAQRKPGGKHPVMAMESADQGRRAWATLVRASC